MSVYYSVTIGAAAGAAVLFLWLLFQRKKMEKQYPFLKKRIGIRVKIAESTDRCDMRGRQLYKTSDGKLVRPRELRACEFGNPRFYAHLDGSVDDYKRSHEVVIDSVTVLTDRDYLITDLSEFKIWKKYYAASCWMIVAYMIATTAILASACALALFICA